MKKIILLKKALLRLGFISETTDIAEIEKNKHIVPRYIIMDAEENSRYKSLRVVNNLISQKKEEMKDIDLKISKIQESHTIPKITFDKLLGFFGNHIEIKS
jgi:hypothetical protein